MKDSGAHSATNATQCHRSGKPNGKARRGAAGEVTRLARSSVRNFGIAPTIHPNVPRSTVNQRKRARVQATPSVRKNSPHPDA
jgi:hypothetical protein